MGGGATAPPQPPLATLLHTALLTNHSRKLDGSLPANPVNDRRIANAVTLKSTFCLP